MSDLKGFWYNSFGMIKRLFDRKIWVVLPAGIVVVTLFLLAVGMGHLHFQPAIPIARGESTTIQFSVEKIAEEIAGIPFWRQMVFWVLIFIFVIIVASLFSPELRKRIILYFLRFALFVLAVFYIVKNYHWLFPGLDLSKVLLPDGGGSTGGTSVTMVFTPPQVSSAILYVISLVVILALVAIAFLVIRWWLQKQRLQKAPQSLESLAEIARASLADISSGRGWEDTIIQCYARMSEVVEAKRGLHRRHDLTASEFATRLEGAGLPGEAVRRLTRLFEGARYGQGHASNNEVAEAIACLTTVLQSCGVSQ
jgi:hypothetical protein